MKRIFFSIGIICAGLCSCADEDLVKGNISPAKVGDEITFSAFQKESENNVTINSETGTVNPGTRTHYGLYTLNEEDGKYSIYWDDGDRIAIYCPQARETKPDQEDKGKEADYKILLSDSTSTTSKEGTLNKINPTDVGLQWGESDTHDFFAFFPYTAKQGIINSTQLKLNLPTNQTPSAMRVINGQINGEKVTLPSGEEVSGKTYIARPNMDCCFMYAHSKGSREKNEPITLAFNPIVTTLEAVIRGPESGEVQVSQVVFRSAQNICGDFSLTIGDLNSSQDGAVAPIENEMLNTQVTIPVYYNHTLDEDGVGATSGENLEPVTLGPGDVLVVRAFLLPRDITTGMENAVTVHMVGGGTRTKVLKTGTIQAKRINITELPKLKKSESNFWMTMLDENVYFSQLSIPGGHNSYDINRTNASDHKEIDKTYQTLSIEEQLAAGARAFSFVVGLGDSDGIDLSTSSWNKDYELYTYPGGEQNTLGQLSEVLEYYAQALLDLNTSYHDEETGYSQSPLNPKEFLVLNIGFQQRLNSGTNNTQRNLEISRWLKEIDRIIDAKGAEWEKKIQEPYFKGFTNDITPTTTLGDLAGKIVVFVTVQTPSWPQANDGYQTNNGETPTTNFNYNPSTDAQYYVAMCPTLDEDLNDITSSHAAKNDRDYDYVYLMHPYGNGTNSDVTIWRQQLERLSYSGSTTDTNLTAFSTRTQTKKSLVEKLFAEAVSNNTNADHVGNWYINNLGGFCVVNDPQSYTSNLGWGGNNVSAAAEINKYAYDYLSNSANNSAPCGVVLMNFFGAESVSNTNVYGILLPQIIIENNYRFALKVRGGSSSGN